MNGLPPIVIYCSSASYGGLEINTSNLATWLSQRGHQVTLCSQPNTPLADHAIKNGVSVLTVKKNKRYGDILRAKKFAKILKSKGTGILFFVDNRDLDFAMWTKMFVGRGIKVIYQQHMMLGIPRKDFLHTLRYRSLDAWITLLPYMAEEIKTKTNFPENRIHIIPLGVDVPQLEKQAMDPDNARKALSLPLKGELIGILGRLDPQKGQHLVIQALSKLKEQGFPSLQLLIMGETTRGEHEQYGEELKQLIRQHHLEDQVYFTGYQQNIAPFFGAIDIFVLGSYGETYGMVTIESMLFGTPVVGSNAGGTPEILQQGTYGWLYAPLDVDAMVASIRAILENPDEAKKTAVRAKTYAQTAFSHTKECKQLEILLTKLAAIDKD
jgi:glycosyltransferase involved in cell wall biosynthesis